MDDNSSSLTEPMDVIVSAGPFTFDDDLSYQPLERLIDTCIEQKPDVVILVIRIIVIVNKESVLIANHLDGTLCIRRSS